MTSILAIRAGQYSEKGVKPTNEDASGIRIPQEPLLTTKGVAAVIADGVSGSAGGREAAEACAQGFLSDYYSTPESWTVKTSGQRLLGALNRWLYGQGCRRFDTESGMITTLSAVVIKSATAHLFHVGDTRIHLFRDGELERLTRDHQTWVAGQTAFLCRAMGADNHVEIDYRSLPVEAGDMFILTTDGVHEYVRPRDLQTLVANANLEPDAICRAIVTRALENGSDDNVTCQILHIEQVPNQDREAFYQQLTELPFPPPLEAGMVLDGYRVLHELHASKRSQIYLALDTETNDKVVIKTPSANFDDDAVYIDRFLHEEWAGRRINNPHVLKVLTPSRRRRFLYYVSEYIDGLTLRQWMNDHPRPPLEDVRRLVKQISAGMRAFHRLEMLHQDIKPENIMIDSHGVAKIIDFGSTRIAGIQEIAAPIERDMALGTLDYAAPEYFLGQPADIRADLYSLGAITYEMLTGMLPYGGALSKRSLPRVSYVPARDVRPDIPDWVDGALLKAVHKNPDKRYVALSEFLYDLSHPNTSLIRKQPRPLLESNPVGFWRAIALILLVINLVLGYLLIN